jgi:hypothetical protein
MRSHRAARGGRGGPATPPGPPHWRRRCDLAAVPRPTWISPEEYLAFKATAEFKSEYYDGVMYPPHEAGRFGMAGASRPHTSVNENVSVELGSRLKGGPCRTFARTSKSG